MATILDLELFHTVYTVKDRFTALLKHVCSTMSNTNNNNASSIGLLLFFIEPLKRAYQDTSSLNGTYIIGTKSSSLCGNPC